MRALPLLALLSACGSFGGADSNYYVVFDELAQVSFDAVAFTEDNTAILRQTDGVLVRIEDGEVARLPDGRSCVVMVTVPGGGVFGRCGDGWVRSADGDTWTSVPDPGFPDSGFMSIVADRESIWVAIKESNSVFTLYRSEDGARFDAINTLSFDVGLSDPENSLGILGVDGDDLWVVFRSWIETIGVRSQDGGASFEEFVLGGEVPVLARTADNIVLGGGIQVHRGAPPELSADWDGYVFQAGIPSIPPGMGGQLPLWRLDLEDHLFVSSYDRAWRSRHPVDRSEAGREEALAGPGCADIHVIYDAGDAPDPYGDQGAVTWTNGAEEPLEIWRADLNGTFHLHASLAPGESATETLYVDQAFMATSLDKLCRGVLWFRAAGDELVFE